MALEAWLHTFSFPHRVAELARRAEGWRFDGMLVADSQNLNADVWVELALAAAATQRLRLGPGVTNPVTRHPAVTASAALTLHEESGGRAVLGLGRGDTALAEIGRKPVSPQQLERALEAIQRYLRGQGVELDGATGPIRWAADVAHPKLPVAVAATGPHVIALAARHADRIDLTVGAEPDRLRWAVQTARAAAPERSPSLGAFLNVAVHPDRAVARDLVRGSAAIFARFPAQGAPPQGRLEDKFIDRFALVGPAEEVASQLAEIAELGIERVVVVPGSLDAEPRLVEESNERFAAEVLPALRSS